MSEYISSGVDVPEHAIYTREFIRSLCGNNWMKEHDLATRLNEIDSRLTAVDYSSIISAVTNNTPLQLTTKHFMNGSDNYRYTKAAVVVDYFVVGNVGYCSNYLYVRYSGFGHSEYFTDVVSIGVPDIEYSYSEK